MKESCVPAKHSSFILLPSSFANQQPGTRFAHKSGMDADVIRCPTCGQANRVPPLGSGKAAVCGKCKTPLTASRNGGHPIELTDANFQSQIASGPMVVDF